MKKQAIRHLFVILLVSILGVPKAGAQFSLFAKPAPEARSASIVTIGGDSYYVHTVEKGETLYSLSQLYDISPEEITRVNPHIAAGLQEGFVIKVPLTVSGNDNLSARKQARLFDTHTVGQGETLYGISRRYEIPVNTLLEDNEGLDPAHLSIGQSINIRKTSVGNASPAQIDQQMEDYRDALNSVSQDYEYHLVQLGETVYSLSRRFGVTEKQLIELNDLSQGLKAGALIKVRAKNIEPERYQTVSDSLYNADRVEQQREQRKDITVRDRTGGDPLEIAIMLPLGGDKGSAGRNFLEFYQGALLGLEDLKSQGMSAKVSLYNTARSTEEVQRIVESNDFGRPDLIIGPVYEENLLPAVDYAQRNRIAIVSPLGVVENLQSPVLYQMAPDQSHKYDKLRKMLTPDKNIVYVTTVNADTEMDQALRSSLPQGAKHIDYNATLRMKQGVFDNVLNPGAENLVIVSCTNELVADQILAALSSYQTNLVARSQMTGNIKVVGGSGWSKFGGSIDKTLFFKLNVCYPSFYHVDRGNDAVSNFDQRFVDAYGTLPSLYAYRGYDAVKLFAGTLWGGGASGVNGGDREVQGPSVGALNRLISGVRGPYNTGRQGAASQAFSDRLNRSSQAMLQMPYGFSQKEADGTHYNAEWGLVCYGSDYTIDVK